MDEQDGSGCTPLHVAAAVGHSGVVRALLAHGARASAQDARGSTPLHAAALHAHLEVPLGKHKTMQTHSPLLIIQIQKHISVYDVQKEVSKFRPYDSRYSIL